MTTNNPNPQANDIVALRAQLFDTLAALSDKTNPMDLDRAKTISDVSQTIINSAKVEVDFMRVSGGAGTGFVPANRVALLPPVARPGDEELPRDTTRKGNVLTHKLRG
jgi:hypothetical protein